MTKSEAYFYRLAMPRPFAKGDGAVLTAIEASAGNKVNYQDGFPSVYSAPHSGGGQYITRGEMNAIGNLASQNQFYFLAGGINTFDTAFATSIGGYPEGAVLKYLNNGYLYDVISLINNNTVDFTAQGVDGVNWAYLSVEEKKVFDDVFFEGGSGVSVGSAILGVVKAKRSGGITLSTSINPMIGTLIQTYSVSSFTGTFAGCGIMMYDCGPAIPQTMPFPALTNVEGTPPSQTVNWNGWKSLSGDFTALLRVDTNTGHGSKYDTQNEAGVFSGVTKDNYYAIGFMCGEGVWRYANSGSSIEITKYSSTSGYLRITYSS